MLHLVVCSLFGLVTSNFDHSLPGMWQYMVLIASITSVNSAIPIAQQVSRHLRSKGSGMSFGDIADANKLSIGCLGDDAGDCGGSRNKRCCCCCCANPIACGFIVVPCNHIHMPVHIHRRIMYPAPFNIRPVGVPCKRPQPIIKTLPMLSPQLVKIPEAVPCISVREAPYPIPVPTPVICTPIVDCSNLQPYTSTCGCPCNCLPFRS